MSMADRDGWIWYDGKLVPWRDANTHVLTHSLHYGLAVFEGVRAYKTDDGTAIFRLREHTDRLFNSAHIFMMEIPFSARPDHRGAPAKWCAPTSPGILLPAADRLLRLGEDGRQPKGATVHVAIAAWPWGAYLGEDGLKKGIRVKTSSFARHHVNVSMARAKIGRHLRQLDPGQHGSHATTATTRPCCSTSTGFVAEGAGENLFIVKNGVISSRELVSGADRHHARHGDRSWRRDLGLHGRRRSRSRATTSTSPTRLSSPAPPPKSRRSANSTAGRSARVCAVRSPSASRTVSSRLSPARAEHYRHWLTKV